MLRKSKLFHLIILLALLVSAVSACQQKVPADPDILYVNITWHQHQPLYYQDADGIYTRPWVRAHATKDYLDMAQKVAQYPDIHATFNFTPSLIRQLNELAAGTKDIYWVLGEKEVSELTTDEKQFILERFFDANWNNIIALYPRYQALLDKRGGSSEEAIQAALTNFTDQDFLDLQVWFNLAWFDPTFLAEEPLLNLVQKGENFDQADKQIVFDKALEIVQEVLPYHAELQREGQIEVTTTPYAHPILPLIYNNQLALVGNPSAIMPELTFAYPEDAVAHLDLSVEMYEENFGTSVRGLWPGEGLWLRKSFRWWQKQAIALCRRVNRYWRSRWVSIPSLAIPTVTSRKRTCSIDPILSPMMTAIRLRCSSGIGRSQIRLALTILR